ncbi:MAG TPA: hypothetical protein VGR96_05280 [Acidobacteriaceae bacterium]|nr:hypothetical protein [Acidobacteriaceae bacterium]
MSGILLDLLYSAEPVLMVVALFALLRAKDRRRFRALFAFLVLRLVSLFVLEVMLHAGSIFDVSKTIAYRWYFYSYWTLYIAGAVIVFFVILELFNYALEPLPGLKRLGLIAFRWVACVSCVAAAASFVEPGGKSGQMLSACDQLMRCQSIFLLSLLFFLMIAAGRLGLSYRSRVFGISFGFGIMAASNLIASALLLSFSNSHTTHIATSAISIMDTVASLLTIAVWCAYFLQKEPVRHAASIPVTSPLSRWNEIAMALGPGGNRLAIAPPASDFFLQDVEKVVDRILTKNSLNVAS